MIPLQAEMLAADYVSHLRSRFPCPAAQVLGTTGSTSRAATGIERVDVLLP